MMVYKLRKLSIILLISIISIPIFSQEILIPAGAVWKYLDDGSDQGTLWREQGFNDSSWASGAAQLGYGDGDETTVVSYGPDPNNKYVTTYFRHKFLLEDPSQYPQMKLKLLRDDGAVVYLNGTEIARSNMPDGAINYQTYASHTVGGSDEDTFFEFIIDVSSIVADTNVIAVEIHQRSSTSSDISFDLSLESYSGPLYPDPLRKGPYLIYIGEPTRMLVRWQLYTTNTCSIEWGTDETYSLGSSQTTEFGSDHQHQYIISNLNLDTKYYYRVSVDSFFYTGSFVTPPPDTVTSLKFLAYGDTRSYPADHDKVANRIISTYSSDPAYQTLICVSGDLVSEGDVESAWDNEFFNQSYTHIRTLLADLPYQSCRGNHEQSGNVFSKYFSYPFAANGCYWSFDYGPAHFVVLDQYTSYSSGSTQLQMVENDLASTDKDWKFIILHEPGWTAGGHSNETPVQNYIQPLCEQYGVQIIFGGHNHYYARAVVNGIQHITTGGGGAPLYTPDPGKPNIVVTSKSHHFCKIDIEGDSLSFTAVTWQGNIIDQFVIGKSVTNVYDEDKTTIPEQLNLFPPYPNPFNMETTFRFSIPFFSDVSINIFNVKGEKIKSVQLRNLSPGIHYYKWDGKSDGGECLSSGIFLCQLRVNDQSIIRKMVLLK